jgi:hypothetical protein
MGADEGNAGVGAGRVGIATRDACVARNSGRKGVRPWLGVRCAVCGMACGAGGACGGSVMRGERGRGVGAGCGTKREGRATLEGRFGAFGPARDESRWGRQQGVCSKEKGGWVGERGRILCVGWPARNVATCCAKRRYVNTNFFLGGADLQVLVDKGVQVVVMRGVTETVWQFLVKKVVGGQPCPLTPWPPSSYAADRSQRTAPTKRGLKRGLLLF